MRRIAVLILSLVTVFILFFVVATYRVRPYEEVMLERFGSLIPMERQTKLGFGWYLCWPTDKVVRMDKRLHLYRSELKEMPTGSQEPIAVLAFAAWRIKDPMLFYKSYTGSDERANSMIGNTVIGQLGSVLVKRPLDSLFGSNSEDPHLTEKSGVTGATETPAYTKSPTELVEDEITAAVTAEMNKVGIEVVQVGFARLALPPSVADVTYGRMSSERRAQAKKFISEGDSQAVTIRSDGERIASQARNTAQQKAQSIRGAADAEALGILAEAQATPEAREFYQFWRELELLKNSIGKESYLILRSDLPLSQQLFQKDGKSQTEK